MPLKVPSIMVSSTFYDLRQIREDLTAFIVDELGYVPLLSELNSFPVNPDVPTIENCRQRVEEQADILVLVVGGRYGSIDTDSARSITNLEYLEARTKNIPVYAFVEKRVLALVPLWLQNKNANFEGIVDDVRVLGFIDEIRSVDKVWAHEFETAREIINALRNQFAYLMGEGLSWRLRIRQRPHEARLLERLEGEALRIALERPKAWEYRLFSQVLVDEVGRCQDLKREYEIGVVLGFGNYVPLEDFASWALGRLSELSRTAQVLVKLTNEVSLEAFGPLGTPGDPEAIIFVACRIGEVYRYALEWAQGVRRAAADERLLAVLTELAEFADDMIRQIEDFGPRFLTQINEALLQSEGAEPIVVEFLFEITVPNIERFEGALDEAMHDLGLQ
jgi:uncharacterized protein DUF4062